MEAILDSRVHPIVCDAPLTVTPDLRSHLWPTSQGKPGCERRVSRLGWVGRIARGVVVVVLGVMGVALAALLVPRAFGAETLVVYGDSMGSAHPIGSVAVTRPVAPTDIEVGDVILVRQEHDGRAQSAVLHRVIEKIDDPRGPAVRTKGDANARADATTYRLPDRVPVATYGLPYLGYLLWAVQTPAGWVALVVLPAALVTAGALVDIWGQVPGGAQTWISWTSPAHA